MYDERQERKEREDILIMVLCGLSGLCVLDFEGGDVWTARDANSGS